MILKLLFLAIVGISSRDTTQLPALHTLKDRKIAAISTSFENQTITVRLKDGSSLVYHRPDWDYENYYPSCSDRVKKAIYDITMTFTKTEVPARFPGGDSAWQHYIRQFCAKHPGDIADSGPATVVVQFVVHLKGQVSDVMVLPPGSNGLMNDLAKEAIREAPAWIPASVNGRIVIAYKQVKVDLH